jgi:hypothetical protein
MVLNFGLLGPVGFVFTLCSGYYPATEKKTTPRKPACKKRGAIIAHFSPM